MLIQRTISRKPSSEVFLPVVFTRDRTRMALPSQLHFCRSNCSSAIRIGRLDRRRRRTTTTLLRVSAVDDRSGNNSGGDSTDGNTNDINSGSSGSGSAAPRNTKNNNDTTNTNTSTSTNTKKGSRSSSSSSSNSNYVVPLDKSSCITRPLAEILRDLNKRIPDNIIKSDQHHYPPTFIPWYHANRMLSFYAPGWCGEIRDVIFSENASVTVVYRVTVRGSDGEAHRESTGTVSSSSSQVVDLVAAAEEIAFCRACARFGLGLYLYHD